MTNEEVLALFREFLAEQPPWANVASRGTRPLRRPMDVDEQIKIEQEKSDRLRLEIEQLKAKAYSLFPRPGARGSLSLVLALGGPMRELQRQLKQSDLRLKVLMQKSRQRSKGRVSREMTAHPLDTKPDIAKRRAIVRQNRKLSSRELCGILDLEKVGLPNRWIQQFELKDWRGAYRHEKCRPLVHRLVSNDKMKMR